jgi:hypothetical protein
MKSFIINDNFKETAYSFSASLIYQLQKQFYNISYWSSCVHYIKHFYGFDEEQFFSCEKYSIWFKCLLPEWDVYITLPATSDQVVLEWQVFYWDEELISYCFTFHGLRKQALAGSAGI